MHVTLTAASGCHLAAKPGVRPAVRQVSLHIEKGEQVAVIGPSGAGKTTLLLLAAAALKPSEGQVLLADQDPWTVSSTALLAMRRQLFYAPQVPPLPPRQRVVTALNAGRLPSMTLWGSLRELMFPDDIEPALEALRAFDLEEKLWERVDRLSGGERQRVGLARALMSPARLWLIDEPLSALDPRRAEQAIHTLTHTAKQRAVTLVTSLHQVSVARSAFPRIVGLRHGELAFDLPSDQVTDALLSDLYANEEPVDTVPIELPTAPKIVHCR
ncbi:MAG: Phosphate-import ATP-binding protein PhnC [Pseudomonadota bacterium]|jgi:phosphonate transport system ATP-binding protein